MMFMDIVTWDPKDNKEMTKRYENWEWPAEIKVVSEWVDLSNCRFVGVYEAQSNEAYAAATFPWRDICYFDSFPVMEAKEMMKFISEHMK